MPLVKKDLDSHYTHVHLLPFVCARTVILFTRFYIILVTQQEFCTQFWTGHRIALLSSITHRQIDVQNIQSTTRTQIKLSATNDAAAAGVQRLDDADFVGNIEGIVVWLQSHVRLLLTIRPDERVDLGHLDAVELADGHLDLRLVGTLVNDEDERVVVLDLLHRGLCRQRELDDLELVQPHSLVRALARVFRGTRKSQSLRATEVNGCPDLLRTFLMHAAHDSFLCLQRLVLILGLHAAGDLLATIGLSLHRLRRGSRLGLCDILSLWLGGLFGLRCLLGLRSFLWFSSFLWLGRFFCSGCSSSSRWLWLFRGILLRTRAILSFFDLLTFFTIA
jgi:hypothetical protein